MSQPATSIDALADLYRHARIKGLCRSGKVSYPTKALAAAEAGRANARPARYGPAVPASPYPCRHCGAFHIGRPSRAWREWHIQNGTAHPDWPAQLEAAE